MPRDFPNLKSLEVTAELHKFRPKNENEDEERFRNELADHVLHIDRIESFEIRFGVGWDKWSVEQKMQSLAIGIN